MTDDALIDAAKLQADLERSARSNVEEEGARAKKSN